MNEWYLFVSHEYYGVLGGTSEFISKFKQNYPGVDQQVKDCLNYYHSLKKEVPDIILFDWLPALLKYVYGQEMARKLLVESNIIFTWE